MFDNSNHNPVSVANKKDNKNDSEPIKKRLLFDQDSDDEDLFAKKTQVKVPPSKLEPEMSKKQENLSKNIKGSRTIFSDSDSDEDFMKSKSIKDVASHSVVDNNQSKLLDSSSDDDLFSFKSTSSTSKIKQKSKIFSTRDNIEVVNKSNEIKKEVEQNSKLLTKDKEVNAVFNKKSTNLENSSEGTGNAIIKKDSASSTNILCTNIKESQSVDSKIIQSSQKSFNTLHTKKINNLFSSDEDDFDDNLLFNVNKSNANVKKDQIVSNVIKFNSSSDDEMYDTNRSNNNLISAKHEKQLDSNEIIGDSEPIDNNSAIISEAQKTLDKINLTGNNYTDKKNTNVFSLLSDDDDNDESSFNKIIHSGPLNIPGTQNNSIMNSSHEDFSSCSSPMNMKNEDNIQNSSLNENQELSNKKDTALLKVKVSAEADIKIQSNKSSSLFSNSDSEEDSLLNSKIINKTEKICSILDSISDTKESHKDLMDGSSFSSQSSNSEPVKKLPGIVFLIINFTKLIININVFLM